MRCKDTDFSAEISCFLKKNTNYDEENLLDNFLAIHNADSTAVVRAVQLLSLQFIDAVVSMALGTGMLNGSALFKELPVVEEEVCRGSVQHEELVLDTSDGGRQFATQNQRDIHMKYLADLLLLYIYYLSPDSLQC